MRSAGVWNLTLLLVFALALAACDTPVLRDAGVTTATGESREENERD